MKLEKFYLSLSGQETTSRDGQTGYIVPVSALLENGGKNEFFRTIRRSKNGGVLVSKSVFRGLEYDRSTRKYIADCYEGPAYTSPLLSKDSKIFIGFTF